MSSNVSKRHCACGLVLILGLAGGCASPTAQESATLAEQDSAKAVHIKTLLIEAPDLAGSAIDVDLENGRVVLNGFVETREQRERAEAIVSGQPGVSSVENRIEVK